MLQRSEPFGTSTPICTITRDDRTVFMRRHWDDVVVGASRVVVTFWRQGFEATSCNAISLDGAHAAADAYLSGLYYLGACCDLASDERYRLVTLAEREGRAS